MASTRVFLFRHHHRTFPSLSLLAAPLYLSSSQESSSAPGIVTDLLIEASLVAFKILQDSLSHRIFQHMNEILNVAK